ncbi:uncharacterized protein RJT21DRAFT_119182 [Scheffersomyces amazonensis]|uniref:uncharacterized protein n=1 Tax=Scheffersomyces amazonensis TaxID=1078765 RepID=UPI00315D79CC
MKAFTAITSLALLASKAVAELQNVSLYVVSDDQSINGSGISAPHEGAGINYVFVGTDGGYLGTTPTIPFVYNTTSGTLFWEVQPAFNQFFGVYENIYSENQDFGVVQVSVIVNGTGVTFENGFLALDGSTGGFYALGNISDPYNYSKQSLAVVRNLSASPEGAIPISLTAVIGGSSSTSAAPSTTASSSVETFYTNSTTLETSTSAKETTTSIATISSGAAAAGAIAQGSFAGLAALAAGLLL